MGRLNYDLPVRVGGYETSLNSELRGIKAEDAIKAFEKAGGVRRSGKGDHVNIKMPNGRIVTLRGKGEVKVGHLKEPFGRLA